MNRTLALALQIAVVIAAVAATPPDAAAQPLVRTSSDVLREANTAALAGDWASVARLVDPLLEPSQIETLALPDLAEAQRLAGVAAFFHQRSGVAESHFLAYLRIELDGRLDPALYPPDVVAFFGDVVSRHAAELRALRVRPRRLWLLTLVPPIAQIQNGERTKAIVIGGLLGAFLIVNITTYTYLRSWCSHSDGSAGGAYTCDEDGGDHTDAANRLRPFNTASGIAAILTYTYGVYDGIRGYRRRTRELDVQPFVDARTDHTVLGIAGRF